VEETVPVIHEAINKAAGLVEALSYIQRFHNKVIVVKVGGSIMDDEVALSTILTDIVFMNYVGMQPVLVHGGGKAINDRSSIVGPGPSVLKRPCSVQVSAASEVTDATVWYVEAVGLVWFPATRAMPVDVVSAV